MMDQEDEAFPRIADDARLECRICWYTYDPAQGDPQEQVAPGTAFCQLPDNWRCPLCDAAQHSFIPTNE